MNKKYFQYIDLPNWSLVSHNILGWIAKNTDYLENKFLRGYIIPDREKLFNQLPQIQEMFSSINSTVYNMGFVIRHNHIYTDPHYDNVSCSARINLPIINCENTYTIFYEVKEGAKKTQVVDKRGNPQLNVQLDSCYEVCRLELNRPAILCINELHGIYVPETNKLPRISATFYLDPDPIGLLK